ncbi:MAG: hypothetical protein ACREAD_00625 [Nitrosopumilaceae archaeon]
MPHNGEKSLECYTARYKLKEARHWLDEMMKSENFNDDERFGWCLNAFCHAVISSIDYVHADFVFNKVTPRIEWKEFTRNNESGKKEITKIHPESQALTKFRGEFKNKKDILLKDPLVNYFYNKRQEIIHIRWNADKYASRSGAGPQYHYQHRALEGMEPWAYLHEKYPTRSFPMFDDYIPVPEQMTTLQLLSDTDMDVRDISNNLCDKVEEFINQFEGKDYFS